MLKIIGSQDAKGNEQLENEKKVLIKYARKWFEKSPQ